jgi:hypothetical protein
VLASAFPAGWLPSAGLFIVPFAYTSSNIRLDEGDDSVGFCDFAAGAAVSATFAAAAGATFSTTLDTAGAAFSTTFATAGAAFSAVFVFKLAPLIGAAFTTVVFAAGAFTVVAFATGALATFLTASFFTGAAAFVLACLTLSPSTSTTTFFGRPRFFGSVVAVVAAALILLNWLHNVWIQT